MPTLGAGSGTPQEGVDDDDDEVDGDGKRKRSALRHSDVLEQAGSSEDDDDDEEDRTASAASAPKPSTVSQPAGPMPYDRRDTLTGAPEPLAPELVTLSLLPRSQWQSLVHLETIKARNRSVSYTCVRGQRGCGEV